MWLDFFFPRCPSPEMTICCCSSSISIRKFFSLEIKQTIDDVIDADMKRSSTFILLNMCYSLRASFSSIITHFLSHWFQWVNIHAHTRENTLYSLSAAINKCDNHLRDQFALLFLRRRLAIMNTIDFDECLKDSPAYR